MNKPIKILIGAALGAGLGLFVGQIIFDYLEEKAFNEIKGWSHEEIKRIKSEEKKPESMKKRKPSNGVAPIRNYGEYFKSQDRPDLAVLAAKYNDGELLSEEADNEALKESDLIEDDQVLVEEVIFDIVADQANKDPRIISYEEYATYEGPFVKVALLYYDDDIVTDDHGEEPIKNPEDLLGDDALVSFGELSDDPDLVYVLNRKKKALYEVARTNSNYATPIPEKKLTKRQQALKAQREDNGNENR